MYSFEKIKLVIWDLDETLWKGTLSEGAVEIPSKNRELIGCLADAGIVNSICSKNDRGPVEKELEKNGLRALFVFLSVNWEPKGERIKRLIENMQLRPANVLFLDDNPSNLEEAKYYCPEIMVAQPDELPELLVKARQAEKKDPAHKRLEQYRLLEAKQEEKETFSSNEEFLYSSHIKVTFGADCLENIDRIHDLVWRSNQLNFTKVRASKEKLAELFSNPAVQCGYVSVSDRFGDYGIVGFYALREGKLLHFCFSCRTLGMGIEQYVYGKLEKPELTVVGEVISDLSGEGFPGWINQESPDEKAEGLRAQAADHSVLIKGPCDLFQILPYIANRSLIDTEFTYVNEKGVTIESTGHTTHIVEAMRLSPTEKQRVLAEVPFADPGIYCDNLYTHPYKLVVISILTDANLGVYRRKGTGERIAFLEGYHPITDRNNWDAYIAGTYNHGSFTFTKEVLEQFAAQYEFVGINTPEQIVENIRYIRAHLPGECALAVMLGGELYYEKNTFPAYENRHLVHREINSALRAAAETVDIRLIDVNRYLVDQRSFYDHFNHYIKPVYYKLAGEIVDLINQQTAAEVRETRKWKMIQIWLKERLAPIYYRVKKLLKH